MMENDEKVTTFLPSAQSSTSSTSPPSPPTPPTKAPIPYTNHFFDKNEAAAKARYVYIRILALRTLIITIAIFAIFSIYWGVSFRIPARNLTGWIVDFDGDEIGSSVTQELSALSGSPIQWQILSHTDFPEGPSDVGNAVVEEHCWVAVTISPGVTARLDASLASGNSYNSSDVITAFAVEARNENAYRVLLRPAIDTSLEQITHDFALRQATKLLSNRNTSLTVAPELLVRPIYYTLQNVRPYDVPVASAVTFVGLIYLLILSFFVVVSGNLARGVSGLERRLTTGSLIRIRLITPVIIYFVLSCIYSLVTLAFELPFDRKFGHPGFLVFWMLAWFGMLSVGLGLEAMITLLTMKYIQIFLILWIISNVSVCLWPLDVLPVVYGYGRVAPFYQISRGVRTIVFNTRNELGLNFGILVVWIVISCVTLPLIQWYQRKREINTWRKEKEQRTNA